MKLFGYKIEFYRENYFLGGGHFGVRFDPLPEPVHKLSRREQRIANKVIETLNTRDKTEKEKQVKQYSTRSTSIETNKQPTKH